MSGSEGGSAGNIQRIRTAVPTLLRYRNLEPAPENDRAAAFEIHPNDGLEFPTDGKELDLRPLTDPSELSHLCGGERAGSPAPAAPETALPSTGEPGFVGCQTATLAAALAAGENCLLAGPTGSGKTACFLEVSRGFPAAVVIIEGKEGVRHDVA